jgi:hypothetical protein
LQGFNIRYVRWAPVGNALVYVDYDNNIYYRRSALSQDDKLTDDGIADEVRQKLTYCTVHHHFLALVMQSLSKVTHNATLLRLSQDDKLTDDGIADEVKSSIAKCCKSLRVYFLSFILKLFELQVYNGIPDWVFEEEVFEDNYALWWSPDGTKLVWGHFNDTEVEFYVLPEYGSWKEIEPYPAYQQVRYPKVKVDFVV